ncbi:carbon-nitrogen hydrolase family protein [Pelagibacterium sediminicola]|uniref:carbon-nitrogen hydrolase family protein n=1 Tax=Pelagibacterium sediminicola TaxID=2248761 RepID=UPI000E31C970|nr:carbon-nitrogen hydrolase family protein [Pelagibacterium sediminicola]
MSVSVRVALAQMRTGIEPAHSLDTIEKMALDARAGGASYVLTPEMSVCFAESRDMLRERTGGWEGNADIARLSRIARAAGLWLHVGSLAIALDDQKFANRSVLFAPDGAIRATYDKIHLFDADIPGLNAYRESATYRDGERAVVADTGDFRLGFSICYDMRFASLYRTLAQGGAQVIAVPAAFTVPTGAAHWNVLLRARAIETGCFILAAAQGGAHENGRATYGHSLVVAPWGEVIASAEDDAEKLIFADLDLDAVDVARQRVPALSNGRDFTLETL